MDKPGSNAIVSYEQTENHWIGSCGNTALVFAYEGASSDLRHVQTTTRLLHKLNRELGRPAQLLFVVRSRLSKPPIAEVRSAITDAMTKNQKLASRAAIVILGSGFGPAIHRGAITGLIAIVKPTVPLTVSSDLSEGLRTLFDETSPEFTQFVKHCEDLASKV